MICPYCGEDNDKVIDSRSAEGGATIRRRRHCQACGRRFTTYERVEKTARMMIIKRDGSRAHFDPQKILEGVQAACGKRPIPEETKLTLVREVEEEIHRDFEREVPSVEIGARVASRLRQIDEIAYIRYASEYYEFKTLSDLAHELSDLQSRPRDVPNQQPLFEESPPASSSSRPGDGNRSSH